MGKNTKTSLEGKSFDFVILKNYPKERRFSITKEMRKGIFGLFAK